MAGLNDLVQKALYLGVGIADYAAEKAGMTLQDLRSQAQKLADEMVARGEMNLEEARKYVDELVQNAQQGQVPPPGNPPSTQPRRIEIIEDDELTDDDAVSSSSQAPNHADVLRQQVQALQEELRRLQQD